MATRSYLTDSKKSLRIQKGLMDMVRPFQWVQRKISGGVDKWSIRSRARKYMALCGWWWNRCPEEEQ